MHIYLIGYRGCGKSTVASLLAQTLDLPMVDTDQWIESAAGKSIREIFLEQAEEGFRDLEQQTVATVGKLAEPAVVALGGGAVLRSANQEILRKTGRRVWLKASPERLYSRIAADSSSSERRPSLTDQSGYEEVVNLLRQRQPIYQQMSELIVETDGLSPDQVVEEIVDWWNSIEKVHQ